MQNRIADENGLYSKNAHRKTLSKTTKIYKPMMQNRIADKNGLY